MIVAKVVVVLAMALLAVLLGTWIASDSGYVIVGFRGWEIATTGWAAVAAVLALAVALYFVFKLFSLVLPRNTKIATWFSTKRSQSARRQTLRAIEEETNGNTVEAIRLLVAAGQQSPDPALHFLRASELAERIGARDKAAELRKDAAKLGQDELQVFGRLNDGLELLNHEDKRGGLRALRRLLEEHPRCAPALLALIQQCHEVEDWVGALEYLEVLSRLSFVADEDIYELIVTSWIGRIRQVDPASVANVWHAVPRKLKHESNVLRTYVDKLQENGDVTKAVHELERSIKRKWDAQNVLMYGTIDGDTEKQLKVAEEWLTEHTNDPVLHLTVGRLHRRDGQPDKALHHLERSVSLGGANGANLELAELYFESDKSEMAKNVMARVKKDLAST